MIEVTPFVKISLSIQRIRTMIRVPRSPSLVPTPEDDDYDAWQPQPMYSISFPQRRVYDNLTQNHPAYFECELCCGIYFKETELATQHDVRHPPTCRRCLIKVSKCPYCRKSLSRHPIDWPALLWLPSIRQAGVRIVAFPRVL